MQKPLTLIQAIPNTFSLFPHPCFLCTSSSRHPFLSATDKLLQITLSQACVCVRACAAVCRRRAADAVQASPSSLRPSTSPEWSLRCSFALPICPCLGPVPETLCCCCCCCCLSVPSSPLHPPLLPPAAATPTVTPLTPYFMARLLPSLPPIVSSSLSPTPVASLDRINSFLDNGNVD